MIDGLDSERLVDADDGAVSVSVVDGVLFVWERSGATERCHRGSVEELDVVFRGDECVVVRSGHVLGADESSTGAFRVEVFGPGGGDEELFSGSFESLPRLSGNGGFVVAVEQRGVSVTHVDSGDEVWDLRDGVQASVASHLGGSMVVAVETDEGEVLLVGFDREGSPAELAELSRGVIRGEFAANGDFYWTEEADGVGTLFLWRASEGDVERLDEDDGLQLAGVHGDAAVTLIADDLGVEFRRYAGSDDYRELDDVKADLGVYVIDGDYIYLDAAEIAAVVPLDGGDATESDFYDDIVLLGWHDGTLVFAADDGFSTTLVSIRSGEEQEIEYDRYDQIHAVQIDGDTLIATVQDGRAPQTIQLDVNTGKQRDDTPEYNDFTLIPTTTHPYRATIRASATGSENLSRSDSEQTETDTIEPPEVEDRESYDIEDDQRGLVDAVAGEVSDELLLAAFAADAEHLDMTDFTTGEISAGGRRDYYFVHVPRAPSSASRADAQVSIWTEGATDTYMQVYAITDSGDTFPMGSDDDSGSSQNAQLQLELESGTYLVEVTGYDESITGFYDLYVYGTHE